MLAAALDHTVDLRGKQDGAYRRVGVHDVELAWMHRVRARVS